MESPAALADSSSCLYCADNSHLDYFDTEEKSASDDYETRSEVTGSVFLLLSGGSCHQYKERVPLIVAVSV